MFDKYSRTFKPAEPIFKQGDTAEHMFIIQSGKVEIYISTPQGEKSFAVIGPGEFFGEMAIIDKGTRSASARAVEETRVIMLDEKTFDLHIQSNPAIVRKILKNMSIRLREANNQVQTLLIKDVNRRIANRILVLCHQRGVKGPGGIKMDFPFGENELAKDAGLTEDMPKVREVIAKLQQAKIIDVQSGQIVVLSVESLEKFIQYLAMKEEFGG
jgi:CRP-like cAMP-binding protein